MKKRLKLLKKINNWKVRYKHKRHDGKKALLDYPPYYVTIGIGGACMNRCEFCASHSEDSKNHPKAYHQHNVPYQLNFKDFCKIVDMCYDSGVPRAHIVAIGEPFLHKDILKMMDYLINKYGELSIQTNFNKKLFDNRNLINEIISRANNISYITTDLFPPKIHNSVKLGSSYDDTINIMSAINKKANILFDIHLIITKKTYENIEKLIFDLHNKDINFKFNIVNLHPHNFNSFTSPENCYYSDDEEITSELKKVKLFGEKLGIKINIPAPWDHEKKKSKGKCLNLWSRFQIFPSKYLPKEKWIGNVIPSQCNAVIMGNLYTVGNLFDYNNLMDFWNNKKLVKLRQNMANGIYPDEACKTCYKYDKCISVK